MIYVFLICLACSCSSLMPFKQSDSIVSVDHTQVVERKSKNNYYAEKQYEVLYSFNAFAEDNYWLNMDLQLSSESSIFLGGTNPNLSNYDVRNNGTHWVASSSTLSSMSLCYVDGTGNIGRFPQNEVSFTRAEFYVSNLPNSQVAMYLSFDLFDSVTRTIDYIAYFDNTLGYIGCIMRPSSNFNLGAGNYTSNTLISLPKSNCGIAISGVSSTDYDDGYYNGYNYGFNDGWNQRQTEVDRAQWEDGYQSGKQDGYAEGIAYSQEQSSTALTIFTGILEVGLLPVNVFLQMFNYEVFGINIAGFISGLITIAMVMIFVRFIFGGKDNGK